MADDLTVYDLGDWLLECVRAALAATQAQAPRRRYVSIGKPAHDNCCANAGQLTVAWLRSYSSSVFPVPDDNPVPCGARYLVSVFEVEVVRCAPAPRNDGTAPSSELLRDSAREILADARAVMNGVRCCIQARIRDWQALGWDAGFEGYVDNQTSITPDGGCTGSVTTVVVGIPDGCACT